MSSEKQKNHLSFAFEHTLKVGRYCSVRWIFVIYS